MHGEYKGTVDFDDKHLIIDGHKIRLFHEMDPANIKWCVALSLPSPFTSLLSGQRHLVSIEPAND